MTVIEKPSAAPDLLPQGRRARRVLAAVAVLAPLAQLAWTLTIPNNVSDDLATAGAAVAERPGWFEVSMLTQTLFGMTAVVSALVLGAAVRAGAPRLGAVATVVAVIGGSVGWSTASSAAVLAGLDRGLGIDGALALSESVDTQAASLLVLVTFPLIPLGYLLLGIAGLVASRSGAVPVWAAATLTASVPLVMVGGALNRPLFALGWVAVTVGVAGLAAAWATRAVERT